MEPRSVATTRRGYDPHFLSSAALLPPRVGDGAAASLLDYMHFSVLLNPARRLAWWSAWNIDGTTLFPDIARSSTFFLDERVPANSQTGEAVYAGNDLDRGHLARRSDLLWGTYADAKLANRESFCFTNIAPQMNTFNQAGRGGVWGELENAVLDLEGLVGRRVSLFAGPVLASDDVLYRGLVQLPREYWKVVMYRVAGPGIGAGVGPEVGSEVGSEVRARAFLLTQDLDGLAEVGYLDEFQTYQVAIDELEQRTGLLFGDLAALDAAPSVTEAGRGRSITDATQVQW